MHINIAYGRDGLDIELPDDTDIIQSKPMAGLTDEIAAIRNALQNPIGMPALATHVKAGDRVVVTHSDITRPVPNDRILPVILQELESAWCAQERYNFTQCIGYSSAAN